MWAAFCVLQAIVTAAVVYRLRRSPFSIEFVDEAAVVLSRGSNVRMTFPPNKMVVPYAYYKVTRSGVARTTKLYHHGTLWRTTSFPTTHLVVGDRLRFRLITDVHTSAPPDLSPEEHDDAIGSERAV